MRNLIDGNSLLYRAFFGVGQRLTRPDGTPVSAVYGFCNMLLPLLSESAPDDDWVCVFDAHRKNWRNVLYPEYKMNRDATPPDLVAQFPLVRAAVRAMGIPCLVVDGVEADDIIATLARTECPTRIITGDKDLMQLVNDCTFLYDTMKMEEVRAPQVFAKFGVRPNQVVDAQALIGDSSDNIPGVAGIGPKKAAELLTEYETLENIYANLGKITGRTNKLLADGRDSAFLSQKLARLKNDCEIPHYEKYKFNAAAARDFFANELGSTSLVQKLKKLFPFAGEGAPRSGGVVVTSTSTNTFIFEPEKYKGLFGVSEILPVLTDPKIKKIAWDWKTIFHELDGQGINTESIAPIEDVMLMNYAINKTWRGDVLSDYENYLANPNPKIYSLDLAILRPLFRMEKNGVLIDLENLAEISKKLHSRADELQRQIWNMAGTDFNIASPKQLGEVLFDKMRLPPNKKRGTDSDVLTELSASHPIAALVLEWRSLTKLTGTYTDALPHSVKSDGRLHTTYLQTSTNTGRLSSVAPNLQNIPVKTELGAEIRKCFVAPAGMKLISADYSQIQLRLLADIADVKPWKAAFAAGRGIHSETAERIFGILTPENRRIAKTINFSIIYGVSSFGLAPQLGITPKEAQAIIDNYMNGLPEVKNYIEKTKKFASENGFVITPMGRKIMIDGWNIPRMKNYAMRAAINAPIQGAEADIVKLAMAELAKLPVRMILQIHDEIIFESPENEADKWAEEIERIMENVVHLSVPINADTKISDRWEK